MNEQKAIAVKAIVDEVVYQYCKGYFTIDNADDVELEGMTVFKNFKSETTDYDDEGYSIITYIYTVVNDADDTDVCDFVMIEYNNGDVDVFNSEFDYYQYRINDSRQGVEVI